MGSNPQDGSVRDETGDASAASALPRQSLAERAGILAFCVAIFLFGRGPIWRHPWSPDASILWSYAPIPFFVLGVFAVRKRIRLASVFLETVLLALVKFGITAAVLVALLTFGPPPPDARPRITFAKREPSAPPAAAVDNHAAVLVVGPGGFHPNRIELPAKGSLRVSSGDGSLHTLHATDEAGKTLFNVPVLANGAPRVVSLGAATGRVSLRCEVHPSEKGEIQIAAR